MLTFLFYFLSVLGIGYWIASLIMKKMNSKTVLPIGNIVGVISSILFVLLLTFSIFIKKVDGQSVGVIVTPSGIKEQTVLTTGWNPILPWWDIYMMDKTVWVYTFTNKVNEGAKNTNDAIWAATSEGIKMGFDLSVAWRIDQAYAWWIYANIDAQSSDINARYKWMEENIIRPSVNSIFNNTIAKYTPIQCYNGDGRAKIQLSVDKDLRRELSKFHILIDKVDLRDVFYEKAFNDEIIAKKTAEQKALTLAEVTKQKQELLLQATIEKNIVIQAAEGEAKALQIKGDAINKNPKIIELQWIDKWDGALPTYMMGNGQGVILNLDKK